MAKSKTYFEQFLDYFKNKISYKVLRMELINEIKHKKRNSKNKESAPALEMSFLEQNFSFFLINTGVLNIFLKRKNGSFIYIFGTTTLFCSYTYLIFVFYGEERFFYRNSLRSDEIGLYLRKKFISKFPQHKYADYFKDLNNNFYLKSLS